jgi:uncharacterized membrane-anchored protein
MSQKIILPAFILMVIAQLYVPVRMVLQRENILISGKDFKFKTAPIDPNDPFRGKYITLTFAANSARVPEAKEWSYGDQVFVELTTDSLGYASIFGVTKDEPTYTEDYVTATLSYIISDSLSTIQIEYPFDRFYMEESKAGEAEQVYTESVMDSTQVAYALVSVKKGAAVVKDVMINDVPIRELVLKNRSETE